MKKVFLIIIAILSFYNCGIHKKMSPDELKIQNLVNYLNYKVVLPDNWHAILDSHNELSYSPKNLGDIFYKNIVRIYDKDIEINQNDSLKNLVNKNLLYRRQIAEMNLENLIPVNTKYGETYIIQFESEWNSTHYISTSFYFKRNNKLFIFDYSSDERFYKKYLDDIDFIFNNLEFIDYP